MKIYAFRTMFPRIVEILHPIFIIESNEIKLWNGDRHFFNYT